MPEPANPNPLAELLEATGMTQTEFAQLTGSTSAQISLKSRASGEFSRPSKFFFVGFSKRIGTARTFESF